MMWLFVAALAFSMLVFIGINDCWGKSLKIFGCYVALAVLLRIVAVAFKLRPDIGQILETLLLGGFAVGLLFYCFIKGHIMKL